MMSNTMVPWNRTFKYIHRLQVNIKNITRQYKTKQSKKGVIRLGMKEQCNSHIKRGKKIGQDITGRERK